MNIYLIEHDNWGYNYYVQHVIVSYSEEECRRLASENSACEGSCIWSTAQVTLLGKYIGEYDFPFMVCSDFRAG